MKDVVHEFYSTYPGREKKAAERLAKTVFSKGARGSPAPKASPAGSLAARASRNGISKVWR